MRFFIALEIPEENKPQFQSIQAKLHTLIPQARLMALEKIHLTLAFIGEQPDDFKDKLFIVAERIKDELLYLNLPVDERRFTPHISVAKLNSGFAVNKDLEEKLEKIATDNFQSIKITAIKLFESAPDGSLHKHNTLAEIKLI